MCEVGSFLFVVRFSLIFLHANRIMRDYEGSSTTVVLISQDTDFVPMLKELQESGFFVAVITNRSMSSF
jgi:uncharacterized LabA/DUF88 family protein